ncbi:protein G10 [Equid gammaherpesvirus 2]|nr:protein G10 [Equid gammaherpesvirus 2]
MEEVISASLADIMLAMNGEKFFVENWKVEVTPAALTVVNTSEVPVQDPRCTIITLPFSVWSAMECMLCRFQPANQLHVACKLFDTTFILQNQDLDQSRYVVVETVVSDLKKPISFSLVSEGRALAEGELRLVLTPLRALDYVHVFSVIYNMHNELPPGLELASVTEYCGSLVKELCGTAIRTRANTYTMAFRWEGARQFYRVTNSYFCEQYNRFKIVRLCVKECKMYRKEGNVHVLDITVVGDTQPEVVHGVVSVMGAEVDSMLVTDRYISPLYNQAWGWALPLYAPTQVVVPPKKTLKVPVDGMFFRGTVPGAQPVCLIGGSNINPDLVVRPVVWKPMTSLVLTLYNNSERPLAIRRGDLAALAVPVNSTDIRTVYSDNSGTLITWDTGTCEPVEQEEEEEARA